MSLTCSGDSGKIPEPVVGSSLQSTLVSGVFSQGGDSQNPSPSSSYFTVSSSTMPSQSSSISFGISVAPEKQNPFHRHNRRQVH